MTTPPRTPSDGDSGASLPGDKLELLVDAYLRGELAGTELESLERDLARSEELRRQVELQRRIEGSLKRLYTPPARREASESTTSGTRAEGVPRRIAWHRRRLTWLSAAAALLFGLGIWSWIPRESVQHLSPGDLYTVMKGRNFAPEFVCTTDEAFAAVIKDRFGQALVPTHPAEIEMVGWGYGSDYYGSTLSKNALVLLARSHGENVVVVMDHVREDRELEPPQACRLKLGMFRKQIGKIVLYEITPRPGPEVSESLRMP